MSGWQAPLIKLIGLIIILPFSFTYLHLYYYTYWKNEYCFVGPYISSISGSYIVEGIVDSSNVADNEIRSEKSTAMPVDKNAYTQQFHGIYSPNKAYTPKNKRKKNHNDKQVQFQQKYATTTTSSRNKLSLWFGGSWPSITKASIMISSPSSQLSNHKQLHTQQNTSLNVDHVMTFVNENNIKKWCLYSSSSLTDAKWCSEPMPTNVEQGTIYAYPPSGLWKASSTQSYPPLVVSCPTPTTTLPTDSNRKGRHQNLFNGKQNKNIQFLLNHPSTTILLLLNIGLAFQYWNQRINPSLVCKQYLKIVDEHEWWRGLTGALAHFELLHIGFNMMSLNTLGRELEGGFGSIVFLVYNIALIVFTTMIMMAMVCIRIKWLQYKIDNGATNAQTTLSYQEQQQRLQNTSSVGFSAVLFAWMVISTMERTQSTCPVPFFNDVCFSTYTFGPLKFNIAPIVSLFVAQFIMPRVSFMGHLAGIVCGFMLHWGVIPPLEICSPNVLISGMFLGGLVWRRRVIPVRPLLTAAFDEEAIIEHEDHLRSLLSDDELGEERGDSTHSSTSSNGSSTSSPTSDPFMRSRQKKKDREKAEARRKQKTLLFVRNMIGAVTLISFFVFGWTSSLVLSQCIILAFFTFGTQSSFIIWAYTQSKVESDIIEPEKQRSGRIWRGLLLASVLTIIVDAMSMASWFTLSTIISGDQISLQVGLISVSLFMLLRITTNLLALLVSSRLLHEMGEVGDGIFVQTFSKIINWTKQIGDQIVSTCFTQRSWTAFEGRGITLGSRHG